LIPNPISEESPVGPVLQRDKPEEEMATQAFQLPLNLLTEPVYGVCGLYFIGDGRSKSHLKSPH
jgi:hypothetical protein